MPEHQLTRRKATRSFLQAAFALAAWGGLPAWAKGAEKPLPKVGAVLRLPDVTLLDGKVWQAADMRGKTLVVYWWASWCPFCAV
ncbi:MAG: hypothetical protein V4718_07470, partial [Pseudomonadota bacterium]